MILKKIKLKNIRSYKDAEIIFPERSVLLSGDIGTGKTSILLAIEFALFGLQPGQKGASLLKNNENQGSVILELDVDGRELIIERSLKRGKTVSQTHVSITLDKEKKEFSVLESKNFILNLLNYPTEFIKKTNLLYRFTVYTPQEEMKQIILEDPETRLNTLRHVFGIDKYKRIKENCQILTAKLREEARQKEGQIQDLPELKKFLDEKKANILKLNKTLVENQEKLNKIIENRKLKEKDITEVEEKIKQKIKYEQEIEKSKIMITARRDQILKTEKEIQEIRTQFNEAKNKFDENKLKELTKILEKCKTEKQEINKKIIDIISKVKALEIRKKQLFDIEQKISNIKSCPTCLQEVSDEHKQNIIKQAKEEESKINLQLKEFDLKKQEKNKELTNLEEKNSELEKQKKSLEILKIKIESLNGQYNKIPEIEKQKSMFEKDVEILKKGIENLKNSVFELSKFENIYKIKKQELEEVIKQEKDAEIKTAEIKKETQLIKKEISSLEENIKNKQEIKKKLEYIMKLEDWLSKNFISLIEFTERNIMLKLREEFSKLFNEWFSILVSDNFSARLDETFSPVIEQQDYELDYSFLSGGERTAIALAYRLALNQTINSIMSKIKTRDIIILDEPTDGFSEQQLDKMRNILQQLNVNQLILVSHEQKIEGFVENIIKFQKENGITKIINSQ